MNTQAHVSIHNARVNRAFTLLEILVAVTILAVLLTIQITLISSVGRSVDQANWEVTSMATARAANDLSQKIGFATLNTYYGYDNYRTPTNPPTRYIRLSDLHFLVEANVRNPGCGQEIYFVSPLSFSTVEPIGGLQNLMNACGFFVQYNNHDTFCPTPIGQTKWRYRLMQGFERTENLKVFNTSPVRWVSGSPGGTVPWLQTICNDPAAVRSNVTPVADNVIALVLMAQDPAGAVLTTDYTYDSAPSSTMPATQPITENQLPPIIRFTVITISEASATKIDTRSSTEPAVIQDALRGRFVKTSDYDKDMREVSKALTDARITYRIFNTAIPLRESKWSGVGAGY